VRPASRYACQPAPSELAFITDIQELREVLSYPSLVTTLVRDGPLSALDDQELPASWAASVTAGCWLVIREVTAAPSPSCNCRLYPRTHITRAHVSVAPKSTSTLRSSCCFYNMRRHSPLYALSRRDRQRSRRRLGRMVPPILSPPMLTGVMPP